MRRAALTYPKASVAELAAPPLSLTAADGTEAGRLEKGDIVSLHGTSGAIYLGTREVERRV